MNRQKYGTLIVTVALWKAVLVLFVSSDDAPMGMMIGQLPETYTSKTDCLKFINENSREIAGMTKDLSLPNITVMGGTMSCVPDESGVGT